ncbi:MAG: helix-turn-helix domain-containing protein, partial [Acutalibacteraceae bacterium]
MNIETANILLSYRKKSGLSQEELAEKVGVSRQAVSKWERAEASPDTDNLILLAQIYGVTVDELLKGEKLSKKQGVSKESDENPCDNQKGNYSFENEEKQKDEETKVSFKNGIHVHDGKDDVDISFKGIHVDSHDGTHVHIDGSGINVIDKNGEEKAYTDDDGHIHFDSHSNRHEKAEHLAKRFPIWAVALLAFFIWGLLGGWAVSWISFFAIPLYYTTVEAIIKKDLNIVCYPVIVVVAYLLLGFYGNLWHPMWILFLTIPLYYGIIAFLKPKKEGENSEETQRGENYEKKKKSNHSGLKITLLVVGIIVCLGAICAGVSLAVYFGTDEITKSETIEINQNTEEIEINSLAGKVNIYKSQNNDPYLNYTATYRGLVFGNKKVTVKESDKKTEIDSPATVTFGKMECEIDLYLSNKELNRFSVDNASGTIESEYLNAKEADFDIGS